MTRVNEPTVPVARAARWAQAGFAYAIGACAVAVGLALPLAAWTALGAIMTGGSEHLWGFAASYGGVAAAGALAALPGFAARRSWQRSLRPMRWQGAAALAALPWVAWIPLALLASSFGVAEGAWMAVIACPIPFASWIPVVALRAEREAWDAAVAAAS